MNESIATNLDFDDDERARHFRLDIGKMNYGFADYAAHWFRMQSICPPNSDWVGVPHPVNLQPQFDKFSSANSKTKWTPHSVAEALERVVDKSNLPTRWSDIRERFCLDNNIKKSQANGSITLISQNRKDPTRILSSGILIDYWITKDNSTTAPWMLHRQEISD